VRWRSLCLVASQLLQQDVLLIAANCFPRRLLHLQGLDAFPLRCLGQQCWTLLLLCSSALFCWVHGVLLTCYAARALDYDVTGGRSGAAALAESHSKCPVAWCGELQLDQKHITHTNVHSIVCGTTLRA
jgi:hypothetical protein